MFFDGWSGILRMLAVGVPAYAALVLLLRIGGKRTLAKLNAFDPAVTVALGSTLASALCRRLRCSRTAARARRAEGLVRGASERTRRPHRRGAVVLETDGSARDPRVR